MTVDASAWRAAVLDHLMTAGGPACRHAAHYIRAHDVQIRFARQSTGARWTLRGDIELNEPAFCLQSNPTDPRLLGLVVHEATHLEQGIGLALSVAGEVRGWQAEFAARAELNAPIPAIHWRTIAQLPDPPTDADLRLARAGMLRMAGYRYLIWLLPLRPNWWTRLAERLGARLFRGRRRA
ncbi:MAG TPA: hypothetical protein ENN99_03970 [Chloroflexi bacterium]|nr:hypothetical protein [Chloroflexota bacterium]